MIQAHYVATTYQWTQDYLDNRTGRVNWRLRSDSGAQHMYVDSGGGGFGDGIDGRNGNGSSYPDFGMGVKVLTGPDMLDVVSTVQQF